MVFYNGREKYPEVQELRLSIAYINEEETPQLELKCMVYNINPDNNEALKAKKHNALSVCGICKKWKGSSKVVDFVSMI